MDEPAPFASVALQSHHVAVITDLTQQGYIHLLYKPIFLSVVVVLACNKILLQPVTTNGLRKPTSLYGYGSCRVISNRC